MSSICPMYRVQLNATKQGVDKAGAGKRIKGSSCISGNRYPQEIGHEAVTVSWLHKVQGCGAQCCGCWMKTLWHSSQHPTETRPVSSSDITYSLLPIFLWRESRGDVLL